MRFIETLVPTETFPAQSIAFPRSRCMLMHAHRSLCPPTTRAASRVAVLLPHMENYLFFWFILIWKIVFPAPPQTPINMILG